MCCWPGCPGRFKPKQWTCLRSSSPTNHSEALGHGQELGSATRALRASSHCPWACCFVKKTNEKNVLLSAPSKLDCREGNCKHKAYLRPQLLLRKVSRVVQSPLSAGKEFTCLSAWYQCCSLLSTERHCQNKAAGSACAPQPLSSDVQINIKHPSPTLKFRNIHSY